MSQNTLHFNSTLPCLSYSQIDVYGKKYKFAPKQCNKYESNERKKGRNKVT